MEVAKKMADALRAGQIGTDFPMPPGLAGQGKTPQDWAKELGDTAYQWRNYLALGAIGPDIFFLLPDFHGAGTGLFRLVDWVKTVYETLDKQFLGPWEKYGQPTQDAAAQIADNLTGDVLNELGQVFNELKEALNLAVLDLFAQLYDWFGLFSSGVSNGLADSGFFWSDTFHYRKTYEFAQRLWTLADTPQKQAFALGWISHCATDVTGHPFTNAKCGGPYRTHWQRHHLIENHMDAYAYDAQHGSKEPYGEFDTSALHFRIAFRNGSKDRYPEAKDAPAYDYFEGFPAYPLGQGIQDRQIRDNFFNLDTNDLPEDLAQLLIDSMHGVWDGGNVRPSAGGPKVLFDADPADRDRDTGMPGVKAIQNTYWILYHYLKYSASSGYRPPRPPRPPIIGDKRPPLPPGFSNVIDDPSRGGDEHKLTLADILLALLTWPLYLAELAAWLVTTAASAAVDLATLPVRETLYEYFVVPAYSAYLAARR
jgi:hypothetical protein